MRKFFKWFFLVAIVLQQSCKSVQEKKISTWNSRIKEYSESDTNTIQKAPQKKDSTMIK